MKEGHTFGNLITTELLNEKNVVFVGYKVPHPLKNEILIKIRTKTNFAPEKAFLWALKSIQKKVTSLENSFESELTRMTNELSQMENSNSIKDVAGATPFITE
ncbi:hypothetical protein MHBO_001107 [Bonamia ostreae]|uniref:DNA-directed RNA polymerase RBP11-like dimerisation domain-containing protein n=1 Tax=Bonamia ostreae TaxID=126728 RepID=A0ABV2AHU6_9EUKA